MNFINITLIISFFIFLIKIGWSGINKKDIKKINKEEQTKMEEKNNNEIREKTKKEIIKKYIDKCKGEIYGYDFLIKPNFVPLYPGTFIRFKYYLRKNGITYFNGNKETYDQALLEMIKNAKENQGLKLVKLCLQLKDGTNREFLMTKKDYHKSGIIDNDPDVKIKRFDEDKEININKDYIICWDVKK